MVKKFLSYVLFVFGILVFLTSCGEKKLSEIIIGEWKVESVKFPKLDFSPDLIEEFKTEMLSSVYIFKEEGKFALRSKLIPDGTSGIYRIKDDTRELYIEYQAGNNTLKGNYQIEIIDHHKIKFKQSLGKDLGQMEAVLVRE